MVSGRVRTRRKALGLTQEQLAERAELSPTYVAKLEAGVKTPSLQTVVGLANALQLDPADIVGGRRENEQFERVHNLISALAGLKSEDVEFVEQEMLRLISHLRNR